MKKDDDLRIFMDVQGGRAKNNDRVAMEIERALENQKIHNLKKLGDQQTQDYATGLADFVYRLGEGQLMCDNENLELATKKLSAINKVYKLHQKKAKEMKMLSETEQWTAQQRKMQGKASV